MQVTQGTDCILVALFLGNTLRNTRKHFEQANHFYFVEVTTGDALKLIKRLKMNKAVGEDQTPPTLVKVAGKFLVEPLTDIINCCFSRSTFPDLANTASVTPIHKGGIDKHVYTNYRPVSVLYTFLKTIDSSVFDQLTKHANENFSLSFVELPGNYIVASTFSFVC